MNFHYTRLPLNTEAIIATESEVQIHDVPQLADETAEVTPSPSVTRVSSSGSESNVQTTRNEELVRQLAVYSKRVPRLHSPSRTL